MSLPLLLSLLASWTTKYDLYTDVSYVLENHVNYVLLNLQNYFY